MIGQVVKPAYDIPLLTNAFHVFLYKRFNVFGKHSPSVIARCLNGIADFKDAQWAETAPFLSDPGFCLVSVEGVRCQLQLVRNDFVTFRLLVLYHFWRYVTTASSVFEGYVTFQRDLDARFFGFRDKSPRAKICWRKLAPVFCLERQHAVRAVFQATKHFSCGFWENLLAQKLQLIARRYTVEDPMALLVHVFELTGGPAGGLGSNKPVTYALSSRRSVNVNAVAYSILNAYINWIRPGLNAVVNTGRACPVPHATVAACEDNYSTYCENCFRIFTVRKGKSGNKQSEMIYCTDTHTMVSSCCGARVGAHLALGHGGTVLEFRNNKTVYQMGVDGRVEVTG